MSRSSLQDRTPGYHKIEVQVVSQPEARVRARLGYWIGDTLTSVPYIAYCLLNIPSQRRIIVAMRVHGLPPSDSHAARARPEP
jgi:hypothetical protein